MDRKQLTALIEEQKAARQPLAKLERQDPVNFTLNGHPYELVVNVQDGFNPDELADRFSSVLSKYDYIVADWGFEQLRLKGFYARDRKERDDRSEDAMQDYLYENCNFGAPYFIIHNLDVKIPAKPTNERPARRSSNSKRRNSRNRSQATGAKRQNTDGEHKNTNANQQNKHQAATNERPKSHNRSNNGQKRRPFVEEKRKKQTKPVTNRENVVNREGGEGKRHFTIRHIESKE